MNRLPSHRSSAADTLRFLEELRLTRHAASYRSSDQRHHPYPLNMTTYEDLYRSLGYLFYSVAACDRSVVQEEIDALKDMTAKHWLARDTSFDELGIESARYIDIAFDNALAQQLPHEEAYARFESDQLKEPGRFDGPTKSMILRTAMRIALAHADVNGEEESRIRALEKLLARTS